MGHVNLFQECDKHYLVLDLKRQNRFLIFMKGILFQWKLLFCSQLVRKEVGILVNGEYYEIVV